MADTEYLELVLPIVDTNSGEATPYFEDYLYTIIEGLGGPGAPTIPQENVIQSEDVIQTKAEFKALKNRVFFNTRVKSVDYTATDNDFVEMSDGKTLKLPENPRKNSQIIVANGDGTLITIDGNGNNIKRTSLTSSIKTSRKGTSLHFYWFIDGPYWRLM
jgi:hypothetical protein